MTVILNYGMGVESSTILHRYLTDPSSRDFPLSQLIVLTAQTGDEFPDTQEVVERFAIPLMCEHEVRWVQVARRGPLVEDGIVVLEDSNRPTRMFREGSYRLSEELLTAGTVPAVKDRKCSQKAKGRVNDTWLRQNIRGKFRQVMGFNADEQFRIDKDTCYGGDNRFAEYPLMKWGMSREACQAYLKQAFGVDWPKSCCGMCPFTRAKPEVLARYARYPEQACEALWMEHVSLALNPRAPLYPDFSLRDRMEGDRENDHTSAFALLLRRIEDSPWAVYRVQRVYHAKGRADRRTEIISRGKKASMLGRLRLLAGRENREAELYAGSWRFWTRTRRESYPAVEEMFVACPEVANEKAIGGFEFNWEKLTLRVVNI